MKPSKKDIKTKEPNSPVCAFPHCLWVLSGSDYLTSTRGHSSYALTHLDAHLEPKSRTSRIDLPRILGIQIGTAPWAFLQASVVIFLLDQLLKSVPNTFGHLCVRACVLAASTCSPCLARAVGEYRVDAVALEHANSHETAYKERKQETKKAKKLQTPMTAHVPWRTDQVVSFAYTSPS
jgi:hypothetical protein